MKRKESLKVIISLSLAAVLVIGIPLTSGCKPAPPAEVEPWKVGYLADVYSDAGRSGWRGGEIAVDDWNEGRYYGFPAKGPTGLLGRPIEFVVSDTHGEVGEAIRAIEYLCEVEKVDIICSAVTDDESMALMTRIAEYKVPFLDTWTSAVGCIDLVTEDYESYKSYFMLCVDDYIIAQGFVDYFSEVLKQEMGWDTTVIMFEDTAYGHGVTEFLRENLPATGIEILDEVAVDIEAVDFSPIYASILAMTPRPDFIYLFFAVKPIPPATQYVELEVPIPVAGMLCSVNFAEWWEDSGGLGEYISTVVQNPALGVELDPWSKEFMDRYQAKRGGRPSWPDISGWKSYDGLFMAFRVAEKVGGFKPLDAWVKGMEEEVLIHWTEGGAEPAGPDDEPFVYYSFYGPGELEPRTNYYHTHNVVYDRTGKKGYVGMVAIEWYEGGVVKCIWPPKYATGKFELPRWLRD